MRLEARLSSSLSFSLKTSGLQQINLDGSILKGYTAANDVFSYFGVEFYTCLYLNTRSPRKLGYRFGLYNHLVPFENATETRLL